MRACSMGVGDVGGGGLGSPRVSGASKVRFSVPSMEFVWETDPDGEWAACGVGGWAAKGPWEFSRVRVFACVGPCVGVVFMNLYHWGSG